jgi:hypothetical protein
LSVTIGGRILGSTIFVTTENITPPKLILKLSAYFLVLIAAIVIIISAHSDSLRFLPIGGTHALRNTDIEITQSRLDFSSTPADRGETDDAVTPERVRFAVIFLAANLTGTILIMLPIAWTYSATKFTSGPRKGFVRALIVLPICASTVVLLIQDSLALAFGLAALVAAVRFRVALSEAIDGIYIFAAICVGLAAGIGYLGVAAIMALFFCMTNAILWGMDYGKNPIDDERRKKKRAKYSELA